MKKLWIKLLLVGTVSLSICPVRPEVCFGGDWPEELHQAVSKMNQGKFQEAIQLLKLSSINTQIKKRYSLLTGILLCAIKR